MRSLSLLIPRSDAASGLGLLRTALGELLETRFVLRYTSYLGALAAGLGRAGQVADGIRAIDEALGISEHREERWCIAELLRIKGELKLLEGATDAATTAEDSFRQALGWAHHQGALSWELRAAASLARLWRDRGRPEEAHCLLAPIYDRFTEGFETADLRAAKALIEELQ